MELFNFKRFTAEGLGGSNTGQRGFDFRVDQGSFLLDRFGSGHHASPSVGDEKNDQGNADQENQGKNGLNTEKNDEGTDQGHKRNKEILRTMVSQLGDVK